MAHEVHQYPGDQEDEQDDDEVQGVWDEGVPDVLLEPWPCQGKYVEAGECQEDQNACLDGHLDRGCHVGIHVLPALHLHFFEVAGQV